MKILAETLNTFRQQGKMIFAQSLQYLKNSDASSQFHQKHQEIAASSGSVAAENYAIRQAYLESEKKISERLPVIEFEERPEESEVIPNFGIASFALRQGMRHAAREHMPDQTEVQRLKERDEKKYGDPNGPSYESLTEKYGIHNESSLYSQVADLNIYYASQRSDTKITAQVEAGPTNIISNPSKLPHAFHKPALEAENSNEVSAEESKRPSNR